MRPITLEMSAFGPFSGTEIIEFELLGEKPLFLINGPTGSGKTTILDGICFALYGSTTGNERDAEQMRCDHAAADLITRVSLNFELNGQHYRISREPRQIRPKAKGEGLTTHSANAELLQLDGSGKTTVLVPRKVNEATHAVEDLMGLNVEQFRQVMVLPQGEFRNLLMADSRQREKIFSDLFQTQVYRRMEEVLKQRSAQIRKSREACIQQQLGMLQTVEMDNEAQLREALEEQQPLLEAAAQAKAEAQQAKEQANVCYQEAQRTEQRYQDLEKVCKQLAELKIHEQEMVTDREIVKHARLAGRMALEFNRKTEALKRRQHSQAAKPELKHQLETAQTGLAMANRIQNEVQAEAVKLEPLRQQENQLRSYRPRVALLEARRNELEQARQEAARQQQAYDEGRLAYDEAEKKYQAIVTELALRSARLKDLAPQQIVVRQLQAERKTLQELENLQAQIQSSQNEMRGKQGEIENAEQAVVQAKQGVTRVEQRWHAGQAAILAQQLETGAACPVCGSTAHPFPAVSEQAIPDEAARKATAATHHAAQVDLSDLQAALAGLEATYKHLQRSVKNHKAVLSPQAAPTLQQCEVSLVEAEQLQQDLLEVQSREQQLRQDLQSWDKERQRARELLDACNSTRARLQSSLSAAQANYEQAENELPADFRSGKRLEAAMDEVVAQINDLEVRLAHAIQGVNDGLLAESRAGTALEQLNTEIKKNDTDAYVAKRCWQEALDNSLFDDEAAYLTAILSELQLQSLDIRLDKYDADVSGARGAEKALLQTLAGHPRPEMAALKDSLDSTRGAFEQTERAYQAYDRRLSALSDARKKLKQAQQIAIDIDAQYAVVGTLSDAASGKTGQRVSLQRFVLSVLLDDVLVEASQRLKIMSKGRYALYRQREKGKGGGASGLELMVEDAYTGKQRPVATLSGGESFMAALALALGLSDVVQAYAGGIHLDTLFIDEGFGSLDPESLDLAVTTLIDLQATGRMVGVISHVPELKEQIDVRLDVIADKGGSRTRIVAG